MDYRVNSAISVEAFRSLLESSGLGQRRPIEDGNCLSGMLENSNLIVTAWNGETLVGIARSVTDFHYACYLSDLAVHGEFQKRGIGRRLLSLTQQQLGPRCSLILLAAPAAAEYYDRLGFTAHPRCWVLTRDASLRGPAETVRVTEG